MAGIPTSTSVLMEGMKLVPVSMPVGQLKSTPLKLIPIPAGMKIANLDPSKVKILASSSGEPITTSTGTIPASSPSCSPPRLSLPPSPSGPQTSTMPVWNAALKRQVHDSDWPSKHRKVEKGGKGLRHFSMKVCEKVQKKGVTSYNEVADELVSEFSEPGRCQSPSDPQNYDQKNIRRRVYDALNVLMAMNIISKEKKEIRWLGLPANTAQEADEHEAEKSRRMERIRTKQQHLHELLIQQVAFKNLISRNKKIEREKGPPPSNSTIRLPFVIVNTGKNTVIDCSISPDKTEYMFHFNDTFEIHDDIELLKRMGLSLGLEKGQCLPDHLEKAKEIIPKALHEHLVEMAHGGIDTECSFPDLETASQQDIEVDVEVASVLEEGQYSRVSSVSDHTRPDTNSPSDEDEYSGLSDSDDYDD